jgi:hypothetical protein
MGGKTLFLCTIFLSVMSVVFRDNYGELKFGISNRNAWACLRVILSAYSADIRLKNVQHIICRCVTMVRGRFNVFGDSVFESKVIQV